MLTSRERLLDLLVVQEETPVNSNLRMHFCEETKRVKFDFALPRAFCHKKLFYKLSLEPVTKRNTHLVKRYFLVAINLMYVIFTSQTQLELQLRFNHFFKISNRHLHTF